MRVPPRQRLAESSLTTMARLVGALMSIPFFFVAAFALWWGVASASVGETAVAITFSVVFGLVGIGLLLLMFGRS